MSESGAIPREAMEVLQKVNTGMIIDALAMSNIQGGVIGIYPVRGFEDAKVIGRAITVQWAPPRGDTPKMSMYTVARSASPGSVLVVEAGGQLGHVVGDNVADCAKRQGAVGIVVNGGVRDVVGLREVGLPIYSKGPAVRQPSNLQCSEANVPVSLGGVTVKPGDVIFGDEDGVVAIPADALDQVIENMKTIFEVEAGMASALKANAPLEELAAIIGKKKAKK